MRFPLLLLSSLLLSALHTLARPHLAHKRQVDRLQQISDPEDREARLHLAEDQQEEWYREEMRRYAEQQRRHEEARTRWGMEQAALRARHDAQRRGGCRRRYQDMKQPAEEIVQRPPPPLPRRCDRKRRPVTPYPNPPPVQPQAPIHHNWNLFGDGSSGHVPPQAYAPLAEQEYPPYQPPQRQPEPAPQPDYPHYRPPPPHPEPALPDFHYRPPQPQPQPHSEPFHPPPAAGTCTLYHLAKICEKDIVRAAVQHLCTREQLIQALEEQRRRAYHEITQPAAFPYFLFMRKHGWVKITSEQDLVRFLHEEADEQYSRLLEFYDKHYPMHPHERRPRPEPTQHASVPAAVPEEKLPEPVVEKEEEQGEKIEEQPKEPEKEPEPEVAVEEEKELEPEFRPESPPEPVVEEETESDNQPSDRDENEIVIPVMESDQGEEVKVPRNSEEIDGWKPVQEVEDEVKLDDAENRAPGEAGFLLPKDGEENLI